MGVLTLGIVALSAIRTLLGLNGGPPPNMPEAQRAGYMVGQIAGNIGVTALQILAILGGIAMIRGKGYGMAMAGTIVSFFPLCGPCFGLSFPFAIWALVLLLNPQVKQMMSR